MQLATCANTSVHALSRNHIAPNICRIMHAMRQSMQKSTDSEKN